LRSTPASPQTIRYSNNPATLDSRRAIVRADKPASPSSIRTTFSRRGVRCAAKNVNTSAEVTSAASLPTTSKNTFKSYAVASHVFTAPRAPTNSRSASTNGSPSVIARNPDPSITRSMLDTKLTQCSFLKRQDGPERSSPSRTARTR